MSKLKLGFVGCGRISQKHFEAIESHAEAIEVVAVCDLDESKTNTAAARFKANSYNDLEQMLRNEKLDLVTIATPNGLHAEQAILCASLGVDVICEKPMAITLQDGLNIKAAFEKHGRKFFLVHQNRYNDTVQQVKKAIDQGRLGRIYMITSNVFWQRPQEYYDKEAWHGTKSMDGGAFMTQASHYIDMINWLVGKSVKRVYASLGTLARAIETEDTGSVVIDWENGTIGNVNVTVLTYPKNLEGSMTIIGEKGTVKIGGVALNEITHWELSDQLPEDDLTKKSGYSTSSVYGFGHVRMYEKVIDYYKNQNRDIIEIDAALESLKILCAILESNQQMKPIVF